jgi:hypothetical protein
MSDAQLYVIRDARGNIYGPAGLATLRQWIKENRIAPEMEIAPEGTAQWQPAGSHPGLAGAWLSPEAASQNTDLTSAAPGQRAAADLPPDASPAAWGSAGHFGTDQTPGIDYGLPVTTSRWSTAALICGIVGLVPFCGIPFAISAIVCGIVGMVNVNEQPQRLKGRGLGLAGLILGIVGLIGCCGCITFSGLSDPAFRPRPAPPAAPSAAPAPAPRGSEHRTPPPAPRGPAPLPT